MVEGKVKHLITKKNKKTEMKHHKIKHHFINIQCCHTNAIQKSM